MNDHSSIYYLGKSRKIYLFTTLFIPVIQIKSVWPRKTPGFGAGRAALLLVSGPIFIFYIYFRDKLSSVCLLLYFIAFILLLLLFHVSDTSERKIVKVDRYAIILKHINAKNPRETDEKNPKNITILTALIKEVRAEMKRVTSCIGSSATQLTIISKDRKKIKLSASEFPPDALEKAFKEIARYGREREFLYQMQVSAEDPPPLSIYEIKDLADFHAGNYVIDSQAYDESHKPITYYNTSPSIILSNQKAIIRRRRGDSILGTLLMLLPFFILIQQSQYFLYVYVITYISYAAMIGLYSPCMPMNEVYIFDNIGFRVYLGDKEIYNVPWKSITSVRAIRNPSATIIVESGHKRILVRGTDDGIEKKTLKELFYNIATRAYYGSGERVTIEDKNHWLPPHHTNPQIRQTEKKAPRPSRKEKKAKSAETEPYRRV